MKSDKIDLLTFFILLSLLTLFIFLLEITELLKKAAYIILEINEAGKKEVLSIEIRDNESSKYWLGIFNSLKNRGLKDILILCADGLSRIKEAIYSSVP